MSVYNSYIVHESGRLGRIIPDSCSQIIQVATPPEFDHGISGHWSPEHLLSAAVGSCFMTTFLSFSSKFRIPFDKLEINAATEVQRDELGYSIQKINLYVTVAIENEDWIEKTKTALEKTKKYCLVSNALKIPVHLEYHIRMPAFIVTS